jgi:hypothetical protein
MQIQDPAGLETNEVRTTRDIDEVLDSAHVHQSEDEAMGCSKCQDKRRKRKGVAYYTPYNMRGGVRVVNLEHTHRVVMGQSTVDYPCPVAPATSYDPSLNCMRDARGNAICSDGMHYPPGCPHTPPDQYFTPGITPDVTSNGRIEGQIPPPRGSSGAPAPVASGGPTSGPSTLTMVAAGGGALGLGTLLFFLFK